jgi:hypothetical protein
MNSKNEGKIEEEEEQERRHTHTRFAIKIDIVFQLHLAIYSKIFNSIFCSLIIIKSISYLSSSKLYNNKNQKKKKEETEIR